MLSVGRALKSVSGRIWFFSCLVKFANNNNKKNFGRFFNSPDLATLPMCTTGWVPPTSFSSFSLQVTISLDFEGNLRDDLAGFYLSSYEQDGETHLLAVTQFQSTDARKAFPCMDEPALKAVFNVRLGRPEVRKGGTRIPIYMYIS